MKTIKRYRVAFTLFALVALFIPVTAAAGDSAEEARALVDKAIQYVQENGTEAAFAAFNDNGGEFYRGDLYIFVIDYDGLVLAHGANAGVIGKNLIGLKDSTGTAFFLEFIATAKNGGGWVDYKWTNPETRRVQDKSTFVMGIPGADMLLGCGIYK